MRLSQPPKPKWTSYQELLKQGPPKPGLAIAPNASGVTSSAKKKNRGFFAKRMTRKQVAHRPVLASYMPTINQQLVALKTGKRHTIHTTKCMKNPFSKKNKDTFKLEINGTCYSFFERPAIDFLLHNLAVNKHVDPAVLITPKQYDANCWFNVMFVTYFISDKGRLFFHFLRHLMITGTQANGSPLDPDLWKTFSLLNYFVDISVKGDPLAKNINTNAIILKLYHIIKHKNKDIYKTSQAGNPVVYYNTIINYLNNQDINILQVYCDPNWKESLQIQLTKFLVHTKGKMPHLILLQFSDVVSRAVEKTRSTELRLNNKTYQLDAACLIDKAREHFSSCLTLEKEDYLYDGMSNHRLIKRPWKNLLNSKVEWSFAGSTNANRSLKKWCFLDGYQVLFYYLVKAT